MEATETDIAPKLTGRISAVLVKEGDRVEAGSLLLRIDSPEVNARLDQANAAGEAAQAMAQKASNGARSQEIVMAKLNWQRAQTAADLANVSFKRIEGLAKEGLIAEQKRDEAQANARAAADAALAARAHWDLALAGARPEDQAAARAQVRRAAGAVAEVDAARAETELKSPVAGEVAKVLAKVGELSPQGVPVVTIVNLADSWVVLNVREDKLAKFAIGQSFEATLPALANTPEVSGDASTPPRYRFKVYYNGVLPDFATWRATRAGQGFDAKTFEVRARPLQPIAGVRPGMTVLVQ